jgi:hypothetical protein
MGRAAAALLFDQLAHKRTMRGDAQALPHRLIVRGSTAHPPPRAADDAVPATTPGSARLRV